MFLKFGNNTFPAYRAPGAQQVTVSATVVNQLVEHIVPEIVRVVDKTR